MKFSFHCLLLLFLSTCMFSPSLWAQAKSKTPFRQVQMHVWISETSEQGLRDIGTNLNYTRFIKGDETGGNVQQITTNLFDPVNPNFGVTLPAPDQDLFPAPRRPDQLGTLADGIQTQSGAGMSFSLIESPHGTIGGVIRGIEENDDIDLISKPELLVIENMSAEIHAGGKVPFQDIKYNNKGVPQLNVAFKDIGVSMKITPIVRTDGLIRLNIEQLEVTDIARIDNIRGIDLPVISKRSQTGMVLVPDGQALVIGGLSSRVVRKSERRVPLIGKLPVVGLPFRSRRSELRNTHLMIFVAPTAVDLRALNAAQVDALEFWRQGTWTNRDRIQEEITIMENEL